MTRILIATTVPGSLWGFFNPFARAFKAQGWRVDGMCREASHCLKCAAEFDHLWDVNWRRSPWYPSNLLQAPSTVRRIVEREGYDFVLVSTPVASFVTRLALRNRKPARIPKIICIAHGFHFHKHNSLLKNFFFIILEKLAGRWTDYLVVINRDDAEAALRLKLVPPERLIHMLGIGVNTQKFSPEAVPGCDVETFRNSLHLGPDNPLYSLVAEFIPRKRHQDALIAFSRLDAPQAHLALAGEGPLLEDMRNLSFDLGIGERVHFLGFRRDVPVIIRASVAVLSVSAQEGLPVNVMESLSLGVPVIGSDIRGTRELLEDGCGIIYPLGELDRLTDAMNWTVSHPVEAAGMGSRGRAKMLSGYSVSDIVGNYINLIKSMA